MCKVRVQYNSLLSRLLEKKEEEVELSPGSTVGDLLDFLIKRYPQLSKHSKFFYVVVNREPLPALPGEWREKVLSGGEHIALFLRATGG